MAAPRPKSCRLVLPVRSDEDALGAASHMGNWEIAEYLLSKGARSTIFSGAMLGEMDVVKALFVMATADHNSPHWFKPEKC